MTSTISLHFGATITTPTYEINRKVRESVPVDLIQKLLVKEICQNGIYHNLILTLS